MNVLCASRTPVLRCHVLRHNHLHCSNNRSPHGVMRNHGVTQVPKESLRTHCPASQDPQDAVVVIRVRAKNRTFYVFHVQQHINETKKNKRSSSSSPSILVVQFSFSLIVVTTVSPLVPSAIPWEMVRERRTPDSVIPMRSAIQVTVTPDRCMPWTTPREYSVSFPPRFTHGSPSRELKSSGMESPAPKIPKNNVFF